VIDADLLLFFTFIVHDQKAIVKYTHLPAIPEQHLVTRRLAQCLNPTLPSGVHVKALEIYDQIFSRIGVRLVSRCEPYRQLMFRIFPSRNDWRNRFRCTALGCFRFSIWRP
jgi:hypothetical protein